MKRGICIPGSIISAERIVGGKRKRAYFLNIQFFDGVYKIRYTEAYFGDPNDILKNRRCNIYKWKGKYIEADFNTLDKEETPDGIIPIKLIWSYPFFRVGKVEDKR